MTQPSASLKRVHIWVKGRVQGVGFRAFVQSCADQLGLTGWVRNVGWDTVEALAEGDPGQLDRFVVMVQAGPAVSRVRESRVDEEPASGAFTRFEILSSR